MNTVIIQKSHRPDKKFNAVVNGAKLYHSDQKV